MGFDVAVLGNLSLPERNLEEWLTAPVVARAFAFLGELGGEDARLTTPEALLAMLAEVVVAPHEFLNLERLDGQVSVRGFVTDDTWGQVAQSLALLFASAAAFGGQGALEFSGYQGLRFGARVTSGAGAAHFFPLAAGELAALERSPAWRELDDLIHARFDALVGRIAGPVDARRSAWSVNPFTGRKERVAASA